MNPSILSIDLDAGRVRIIHSSGRVTIEPAALQLRATGSTYALHIKASRSGVYLREVSAEHAALLAQLGVEMPAKAKPSRGWLRGTFRIQRSNGTALTVCGVIRGRMGIYRGEVQNHPWSLTDLPSGLAIERFRTAGEARRNADEIEADPAFLTRIEAASLTKQKETHMKALTSTLTCSVDDRTFLANKAGQPAAYGNRKQAQAFADRAIDTGGWTATIEPAGGRFRVALVLAESLNPGAELAESPAPIEPEVAASATAGPWTESEAGVWDHASGRATVTGTNSGKWVAVLDGVMLAEGKATRYFKSAEIARGAAEDELAEPAEKAAPRVLKAAKQKKTTVTPTPKPERATGGLTAGQLAAQTKGPDRLREIAARAAATRAARRAAQAQVAA